MAGPQTATGAEGTYRSSQLTTGLGAMRARMQMHGSPRRSSSVNITAGTRKLNGRTRDRAIGTEDATVTGLWPKKLATSGAFVEI